MEFKKEGWCIRCGRCCKGRHLYGVMTANDIEFKAKVDKVMEIWQSNPERTSCSFLTIKHGFATCKIFENRPEGCKAYPSNPEERIQHCGYKFVPIKKEENNVRKVEESFQEERKST